MKRTTALLILTAVLAPPAAAQIVIRDVIPNPMSDEKEGNVEPFIVFNPADPRILVISAGVFADPTSSLGTLFVSFDGGDNWERRDVIPTCMGCLNTGDITMSYNASGRFFAGILSNAVGGEVVLTSTDATFTTPLVQIASASPRDQPYIQSGTVLGWYDPDKERTYVAAQTASGTSTARMDQMLDAGAAAPVTQSFSTDTRMPAVFDNFYVRPAVHPDGTIYTAFVRHLSSIAGGVNAELVIRRDNTWARTPPEYQSLSGATGVTVASYPLSIDFGSSFGGERHAGDLALAVDPRDSRTIYLSYASRTSAAQPITLHLLRSTTGGSTWSADLLTIPNAKNSSIAVNSQGRLAYLYQQLTGTTGSRHWVTHLQRSPDGGTWSDNTLSDFPGEGPGAPPHPLGPYIADYDRVMNIGKNFYGTFAAGNDPVTFPAGTSFLRNVSGGALVGNDGTTPVPVSVDPFFFRTTEMAADADVYARDWTDAAAVRDHGLEPSIRNAFYVTSDVWNRRSNDPQPFDGNDRPQQEDPHPAAFGHNWAFARVSREAAGSTQNVSLEFLFSDGGVGTNYVSAGTTMLSLGSGADRATLGTGNGLQWDLPSGASNHVCLATQIWTAGDPYLGATLAGRSPGWGGTYTDLEILNDNNKAQRNMQVYFGLGQTSGWTMVATIHNASSLTRDMQVGIDYDLGDVEALLKPRIRFVSGNDRGGEPAGVRPRGLYTLKAMRPGESRWVEITGDGGALKRDAAIQLFEVVGSTPINGYAFVFHPAALDDVLRDNVTQHAALIARLADHGVAGAKQEVERVRPLLDAKTIAPADYVTFVRRSVAVLRRGIHLPRYPKPVADPFGIPDGVAALAKVNDPAAFAAAHRSLLNRADALVSIIQKQGGDVADVWQMVRVQRDRFSAGRFANRDLVRLSERLLQRPSAADYRAAVQQMLPYLKQVTSTIGDRELTARYTALAAARGVEAIEVAHRNFLWRIEELE